MSGERETAAPENERDFLFRAWRMRRAEAYEATALEHEATARRCRAEAAEQYAYARYTEDPRCKGYARGLAFHFAEAAEDYVVMAQRCRKIAAGARHEAAVGRSIWAGSL